MTFYSHSALLAMAPPPGQSQAPWWMNLFPMVMMVVVFYFVFIRPQQKKANDHAEQLKSLKSGDRVATSGGILGVVVSVKDKSVTIRSADTKLEVQKTSVTEILERAAASSEA